MQPITISRVTARRFVLGRQGLWPGRRWAGKDGTAEALRMVEAVQMDPINVVARSHDIVLWQHLAIDHPAINLPGTILDLFFDVELPQPRLGKDLHLPLVPGAGEEDDPREGPIALEPVNQG